MQQPLNAPRANGNVHISSGFDSFVGFIEKSVSNRPRLRDPVTSASGGPAGKKSVNRRDFSTAFSGPSFVA